MSRGLFVFLCILFTSTAAHALPVAAVAAALAIESVAVATLVTFAINAVLSMALNFVLGALTKPKAPKLPDFAQEARDRTITARQPISPMQIVYGEVRVGGIITFIDTSGGGNEFLHMVITLAGHQVEEIGGMYFDGTPVPLDGSGDALGAADIDITAHFFGVDLFTITQPALGSFKGHVHVEKKLGAPGEPAFAGLISALPEKWTNDHRQDGCASVYVRLKYASDAFPNGIPNISFVIKGKNDIYDPRLSPPTTAYTNNWALCLADYLCDPTRGLGAEYADEIREADLVEAANISDEEVATVDGGTETRYAVNGTFDLSESPADIIGRLNSAAGGRVIRTGGKWILRAGAYREPDGPVLTIDDIVGPVRVATLISRRESFNGVKGTFVSPQNSWQPDDFPAVSVGTYVTEDGGEERWKDVDYPFTTSPSAAQRLSRMDLERGRRQITVSTSFKTKAWRWLDGDTVKLTFDRYGWAEKTFEVQKPKLTPSLTTQVDVTLREVDPGCYAWSTTDELVYEASPRTNLPSAFNVTAPANLLMQSGNDQLFVDVDGTVFARMLITWEIPADSFSDYFEVSVQRSGDPEAVVALTGRDSSSHYVAPVRTGDTYTVSVVSISTFGVRSTAATGTHVVLGKSALPPDIATFVVTQDADGTRRFDGLYPDKPLDFAGFRVRYTSSPPIDWDTDANLLTDGGLITALPFESNSLPAGTYEFAIKPVDTSGNESANATVIAVTLGDPRIRNAIFSQDEYGAGWPGTVTGGFIDYEGVIEANNDTGGTWADLTGTWDSLTGSWLSDIPRVATVKYETEVIDLGADLAFTPLVVVDCDGTSDVKMRTGMSGDSPPVSGAYGAVGQVTSRRYVQFEVTVTGSQINNVRIILDGERLADTFEDLDTGSETADWFESLGVGHFRVATRNTAMALLSQASITALQNVGPGFDWEVISKAATVTGNPNPAAEFKIYDASHAPADAVVDITLTGPKQG